MERMWGDVDQVNEDSKGEKTERMIPSWKRQLHGKTDNLDDEDSKDEESGDKEHEASNK